MLPSKPCGGNARYDKLVAHDLAFVQLASKAMAARLCVHALDAPVLA
jgi:hypothetical protein